MISTATATATAPERKTGERLIRAITLIVQEMTPEAFAPYGEIIGERGQVDLDLDGGKASFVAQTVEERPFRFNFFARHQRTEQVFVPLGGSQSPIAKFASGSWGMVCASSRPRLVFRTIRMWRLWR